MLTCSKRVILYNLITQYAGSVFISVRWSTVWISFFKCYAWILCWKMHVISKSSPDYKLGILLSRTRPTKNDSRRNMYGNNLFGPEIWTSFNSSVKLGNHSISFATTKNRTENTTTKFNTCIDKMPASIWTKFSVKNCDEYQLSEGHLLEMKTIDDCVDYGF